MNTKTPDRKAPPSVARAAYAGMSGYYFFAPATVWNFFNLLAILVGAIPYFSISWAAKVSSVMKSPNKGFGIGRIPIMTRQNEKPEIVRKLVIFSDICSSTTILEDLKATDNLSGWVNLLIHLKEDFINLGQQRGVEMHKFLGDGWVFLAAHDITKDRLFGFLDEGSYILDMAMDREKIYDKLSRTPDPLGLTFGIDSGELIKLEMNEQVEYVGRPLNVASRLQGAAKKYSQGNGVSGLISRSALAQLHGEITNPHLEVKFEPVNVSLKNISGGQEIDCWHWS